MIHAGCYLFCSCDRSIYGRFGRFGLFGGIFLQGPVQGIDGQRPGRVSLHLLDQQLALRCVPEGGIAQAHVGGQLVALHKGVDPGLIAGQAQLPKQVGQRGGGGVEHVGLSTFQSGPGLSQDQGAQGGSGLKAHQPRQQEGGKLGDGAVVGQDGCRCIR